MRIIFGFVPLASGRHVTTTPTPEGVKAGFALDGKPKATIEMNEAEAKELANSILAALARRAEMKAAGE